MTMQEVSVAEAKKHLCDLLGRVAYRGERITILKRGKPMAVLVSAAEACGQKGISEFRGWLEPSDPFFEIMDEIIADREKPMPRIFKSAQS